jgi:hypothetical protein
MVGVVFSNPILGVLPDLLLFVLLFSFSPFPVMTKSAFFKSRWCLLLIKNQNAANEAINTNTTGTTMAGIKEDKFEEDFEEAAADVEAEAAADVRTEDEVTWVSAERNEENSAGSFTKVTTRVVSVVKPVPPVTDLIFVCVMVAVVSVGDGWAKVIEAPGAPKAVGAAMLAGMFEANWGALGWRPWRVIATLEREWDLCR